MQAHLETLQNTHLAFSATSSSDNCTHKHELNVACKHYTFWVVYLKVAFV